MLNELDQNICISTDPGHKTFVYVNIFHCIYVIFFAMHEKFVLIIIIV